MSSRPSSASAASSSASSDSHASNSNSTSNGGKKKNNKKKNGKGGNNNASGASNSASAPAFDPSAPAPPAPSPSDLPSIPEPAPVSGSALSLSIDFSAIPRLSLEQLTQALRDSCRPIDFSAQSKGVADLISQKLEELESLDGQAEAKSGKIEITLNEAEKQILAAKKAEWADKAKAKGLSADAVDYVLAEQQRAWEEGLATQRRAEALKERLIRAHNQRGKLEFLCKELEKRLKQVQEDTKSALFMQQSQYEALRDKFQSSLGDVANQLKLHGEERKGILEENLKLRESLNGVLKYQKMQEEHFNHLVKTRELEKQLAEAKLGQAEEVLKVELERTREIIGKWNEEKLVSAELKTQLKLYGEKFDSVQETLGKSNELFSQFKSEIEKSQNENRKLGKAKEKVELQLVETQRALLECYEERKAERVAMEKIVRQRDLLQGLCKQLEGRLKEKGASVATGATSDAEASTGASDSATANSSA